MFHVKHIPPHIFLINPWITDFAAYNFWVKPLGLLRMASLLKMEGFRITLIDCLDYLVKTKRYGEGNFFKTKIEKPVPLKSIPRNYCQYGITEEMLLKRLSLLEEPDLICIGSGMTYWYPGVFKVIEITRKLFNNVRVILGGNYATLCYEHAKKHSGVDIVFNGREESEVLKLVSDLTGFETRLCEFRNSQSPPGRQTGAIRNETYPAFDLYPRLNSVAVATSKGCPLKCTYCASPFLTKGFSRRDPYEVVDEIEYWTGKYGVNNIAFYDDALLIEPSKHIIPILKEIIKRGIDCNFHTPNALHVREIDEEVGRLLFRAGFKTIRLGFETSNEAAQLETGGKVDNQGFKRAIRHMKGAGYSGEEIGVYVMAGLPGQRVGEVEESIAFVKEAGARPMLVEYSPIPHTPLFEKAKKMSPFDLENEPLYHNNSILPCQWDGFTIADFGRLKEQLRRGK
jgi:radical SAM superfamily enzyme YgiQ (UPF0313 family)